MITMPELLEDSVYWNFLLKKPKSVFHTQAEATSTKGPWVVYLKKTANSPWQRKIFHKYKKALKFFWRVHEAGYYDFSLGHRSIGSPPPKRVARIKGKYVFDSKGNKVQVTKEVNWKPKLSGVEGHHYWCSYCRRPTIFTYFHKHHALSELISIDPSILRCTICGISARTGAKSL